MCFEKFFWKCFVTVKHTVADCLCVGILYFKFSLFRSQIRAINDPVPEPISAAYFTLKFNAKNRFFFLRREKRIVQMCRKLN